MSSDSPGATATAAFEGRRVLLFAKLGAESGRASVSVDGGPAETVDTYSADDIWGACVYEKELPTAGPHTLTLTVLGEHSERAKGAVVSLDGARAEAQ